MNFMPEIIVNVKVESVWLIEKTDLNLCLACKEKIYGDMLRLWIMPEANKVRLHANKTDLVLCEGCFSVLT
jgi:hypothetical protein